MKTIYCAGVVLATVRTISLWRFAAVGEARGDAAAMSCRG